MVDREGVKKLMEMPILDLFKMPLDERAAFTRPVIEPMTEEEFEKFDLEWIKVKRRELGVKEGNDEDDDEDEEDDLEKYLGEDTPNYSVAELSVYMSDSNEKDEFGWPLLKPGTPPEIRSEYIKAMRYSDMMEAVGIMVN